jgi:hypothetical protein
LLRHGYGPSPACGQLDPDPHLPRSRLLCSGRQLRLETANDLPPGLEHHLLGGAASLLAGRVATNELDRLPSLVPHLTEIFAGPFRDSALDWWL